MDWFWNLPWWDRIQIGIGFAAIVTPGWMIVGKLDEIIALLRAKDR